MVPVGVPARGLKRDFQSPRTEPGRASLDRELDLKPRPLGYESPRGLAGNHLISRRMSRTTSNYGFFLDSPTFVSFQMFRGGMGAKREQMTFGLYPHLCWWCLLRSLVSPLSESQVPSIASPSIRGSFDHDWLAGHGLAGSVKAKVEPLPTSLVSQTLGAGAPWTRQ